LATAPLFVADLATLKSKIRLSGVAAANDAEDIINEAILTVRSGFYRELGAARTAVLVALPFNESPTTENEILRAVANITEVKWVRLELMRTLPTMFKDGTAEQNQIFQDEALFRDTTQQQLDADRLLCEQQIAENLDLLRGDESLGTESTIRVATPKVSSGMVDPESVRPRPGDSILPEHVRDALFEERSGEVD
jgi:hypothetical protein